MNKQATAIRLITLTFTLFLLNPSSHASDVIYFTNGDVVIVEKAWEEDGEIKYQTASGTQSIPKSNVKRIQAQKGIPNPAATSKQQGITLERNSGVVNSVPGMLGNQITSKYFLFYSNIPRHKLQYYADFSDQFLELINQEFVHLEGIFPIKVFVLEDRPACQHFLKQQMNVDKPPVYGIWLQEKNAIVTYEGAGLGTFAHEIMHPLMEQSLKNRPPWASEGIPTFFEKFYGSKKNGKLFLQWGYQNPWRIRRLGNRLTRLKLAPIISDTEGNSESESEQRLVSLFLFEHGKWKTFLDQLHSKSPDWG